VFPVSVETQTAILSVVDKAVSDVLAGSYVDAISQDKGRGVANVSVVLNLADETTVRHSAHTSSFTLQVNAQPPDPPPQPSRSPVTLRSGMTTNPVWKAPLLPGAALQRVGLEPCACTLTMHAQYTACHNVPPRRTSPGCC